MYIYIYTCTWRKILTVNGGFNGKIIYIELYPGNCPLPCLTTRGYTWTRYIYIYMYIYIYTHIHSLFVVGCSRLALAWSHMRSARQRNCVGS